MLTCGSCGAEIGRGWQHCGSCGAPVPGRRRRREPVPTLAPVPARPSAVAALVTAVVVLNLASLAMLGAERRLQERSDELGEARSALRDSRELAIILRTELAARVKERDDFKADLEKTKGNLTDAQRSVETQGRQLETLKDCLTAIEDIGIAIDEDDEPAAREAIERANEACGKAEAFL